MFNHHDDSKEKNKSLEGRLEAAFIRIDKLEKESKFTFIIGKKVSQVCYYDGGGRQYEVDEIKSKPMLSKIFSIALVLT